MGEVSGWVGWWVCARGGWVASRSTLRVDTDTEDADNSAYTDTDTEDADTDNTEADMDNATTTGTDMHRPLHPTADNNLTSHLGACVLRVCSQSHGRRNLLKPQVFGLVLEPRGVLWSPNINI